MTHVFVLTILYSWQTLVGKFVVISSDAHITRHILLNSSEEMPLILHPNAYKLLGKENMAFMNGPYHKELRNRLLPLFSPKALSVYLDIQQETIFQYLKQWHAEFKGAKEPLAMKSRIWDLNCHTSMSVFIGPYLTEASRLELQNLYKKLTDGFLAFPLDLPGTALNDGVKAKPQIIKILSSIARSS